MRIESLGLYQQTSSVLVLEAVQCAGLKFNTFESIYFMVVSAFFCPAAFDRIPMPL